MFSTLPPVALALGLAGLLPFLGCGLGALGMWQPEAMLLALVAYGAVILAFLGGVHWGFALPSTLADRSHRLALSVVPSLIGWVAILLALLVSGEVALLLLAGGFAVTLVVETRIAAAGQMPEGYMGLRWMLSLVVLTVLVGVAFVRFFGGKIIF